MTAVELKTTLRTVEVKIVNTELREGDIELLLDALRLMGGVPDLRGQEKLLTLDDGRNDFFESSADFVLVLVDSGKIEVAVSIANSDFNLRKRFSTMFGEINTSRDRRRRGTEND